MKTKLNIFCILILAVIVVGAMNSSFSFQSGFNAARRQNPLQGEQVDRQDMVTTPNSVTLIPVASKRMALTVKNEVNGKDIKVWPTQMYVDGDIADVPLPIAVASILAVVGVGLWLMTLVAFIIFIVNINHDRVIERQNVKMLRLAGIGLTVYGLMDTLISFLTSLHVAGQFAVKGYSVNYWDTICFTPIMFGMIAFVAAQVFAITLKMKEEQDLTI
ncbi:MAG: DUF2975 domain-containing protein [Prevotellaceae bacterium]|nr:DUF2975 domain-containing protein [Prevotellaceae bacterium]MDY6130766.1 DUF2975 domain-containing protein [Prevotella sp.]